MNADWMTRRELVQLAAFVTLQLGAAAKCFHIKGMSNGSVEVAWV